MKSAEMFLLDKYRRICDSIHSNGNVYYDEGRMEAYVIVSLIASILRKEISERNDRRHETSNS